MNKYLNIILYSGVLSSIGGLIGKGGGSAKSGSGGPKGLIGGIIDKVKNGEEPKKPDNNAEKDQLKSKIEQFDKTYDR